MENNTEVRRDTYIMPIRDSAVSAKAAEKIEAAEEYDLVASLLAAAEYQKTPDLIQEVEIKRKGRVFFTVHLHPVSEDDITLASKKASKYYENPQGKKLPRVRGEMDTNLFHSWIIYLATTEEDREKIWGNRQVMEKVAAVKPAETINHLLIAGEKAEMIDIIMDISRMSDEEDDVEISREEYAKN